MDQVNEAVKPKGDRSEIERQDRNVTDKQIEVLVLSIAANQFTVPLPTGKEVIEAVNNYARLVVDNESLRASQKVAEAARDFVWEPENWEAYQESKGSISVAWPPEFLLMAQAVEKQYGPMPVDADET